MMLRVQEIFTSIDGEVNHHHQGCFTTFIRLAGCNLRCRYCDTERAWEKQSGTEMTTAQIMQVIESRGCQKVTITGGEPLWQMEDLQELVHCILWDSNCNISVETNGTIPPFSHLITGRLTYVVDYKLPSSGMMDQMMYIGEFVKLSYFDFIKFVIMDRKDYIMARIVKKDIQQKGGKARFAFSPVHGTMDGEELINWCKEDRMFDVIINLQLHKILKVE